MPKYDDPVIFTCLSGRRALVAAKDLISRGFTNVKYYQGSWLEWCVKENLPCE